MHSPSKNQYAKMSSENHPTPCLSMLCNNGGGGALCYAGAATSKNPKQGVLFCSLANSANKYLTGVIRVPPRGRPNTYARWASSHAPLSRGRMPYFQKSTVIIQVVTVVQITESPKEIWIATKKISQKNDSTCNTHHEIATPPSKMGKIYT